MKAHYDADAPFISHEAIRSPIELLRHPRVLG